MSIVVPGIVVISMDKISIVNNVCGPDGTSEVAIIPSNVAFEIWFTPPSIQR